MSPIKDADERHLCRVCGEPLALLDEKAGTWYCYKDDELFYANENRWAEPHKITRPAENHVEERVGHPEPLNETQKLSAATSADGETLTVSQIVTLRQFCIYINFGATLGLVGAVLGWRSLMSRHGPFVGLILLFSSFIPLALAFLAKPKIPEDFFRHRTFSLSLSSKLPKPHDRIIVLMDIWRIILMIVSTFFLVTITLQTLQLFNLR
jgi:hypothetical protein